MSAAWFRTYTGQWVDLLNPRPEDVTFESIARPLSRICRFGGHCRDHYSVAQHSVEVSRRCLQENALIGLLHDASEAFIADIVSPLKRFLPTYYTLEAAWQSAIGRSLGLGETLVNLPPDVHTADKECLAIELRCLFDEPKGSTELVPLPAEEAYRVFCERFRELSPT
jgi:hypothetical protein